MSVVAKYHGYSKSNSKWDLMDLISKNIDI